MECGVRLLLSILLTGVCILSLTLECIVPSGTAPDTLKISMADTVAPFGMVKIAFDNSIEDSTVMIKLLPNNILFTANLNKQKDTAFFSLPLSVLGNSEYRLMPEFDSGSFWYRKAVSAETLFFHTWPKEVEPNNSAETADSFATRTYGSLSTTDDLDWYSIDTSYVSKCVLKSYGTTVSMCVIKSSGEVLFEKDREIDKLLFTVPDHLKGTAFIIVYTHLKSAGGYYEITIRP
jgi:hypothetical protein